MLRWENQTVRTPMGRVTRNLLPVIADYRRSRLRRAQMVKLDADMDCTACGATIYAGCPAVVLPDGRMECPHCAGTDRTCESCGDDFESGYDCCTNPRCQVGQENIQDIIADRQVHAVFDDEAERHFERIG